MNVKIIMELSGDEKYWKLCLFTFIKSMGKNSEKTVLKVLIVLKTPLKLGITCLNLQKHQTMKLFVLPPIHEQEILG